MLFVEISFMVGVLLRRLNAACREVFTTNELWGYTRHEISKLMSPCVKTNFLLADLFRFLAHLR